GLSGPAGKQDLAQYMYGRDLEYAPGSQPVFNQKNYSNYGYVLLSLVVEKVSGQDYFQYLRSQVLAPDGINEVAVYPTAAGARPANLVEADDPGLGESALAPKAAGMVPAIYSGDGMVKEACVGSCGLAATATALTQVIRRHAVWGIGGRVTGAREGSTWG